METCYRKSRIKLVILQLFFLAKLTARLTQQKLHAAGVSFFINSLTFNTTGLGTLICRNFIA
jgi:hypothetical protein